MFIISSFTADPNIFYGYLLNKVMFLLKNYNPSIVLVCGLFCTDFICRGMLGKGWVIRTSRFVLFLGIRSGIFIRRISVAVVILYLSHMPPTSTKTPSPSTDT